MMAFLKFVFGPTPVHRRFRYNERQQLWCPVCLTWGTHLYSPHHGWVKMWARRARRWFQGKRDHQTP